MNTKPMIFTTENIRGIRDGRKTMTRRVITAQNSLLDGWPVVRAVWRQLDWSEAIIDQGPSPGGWLGPYFKVPCPERETVHRIYPKYQAGDLIWTRETWRKAYPVSCGSSGVVYRADKSQALGMDEYSDRHVWKPSIHMPRSLSRLTLRVSTVRVERVQDISEEDVQAEGCTGSPFGPSADAILFPTLWDSINGKRAPWVDNPLVWVISWDKRWNKNVDAVIKELGA